MRHIISIPIIVSLLVLSGPAYVSAQSILITDCQGFTRAAQKVKANSLNSVEINVSEVQSQVAQQVDVTLTNTATGQSVTSAAQNGVVVFKDVAPGAFTVTSSASGVGITSVAVLPAGLTTIAASGVIAGAAAVGGGVTTGVVIATDEVVNQIDGKSDSPAPTPTAEPSPTPLPPVPTPDCNCDPSAEPDPIDDFFKQAIPTPLALSPAA